VRRLLAILAVSLLFLLTGCFNSGITEGRVIDKGYVGPSSTTSLIPVSCGQYCWTYVPITSYQDEYWYLELQDCSEHPEIPLTTHLRYDECKHGRVKVDPDTYVDADFGYPFPLLRGDR
jgi:hypothetical protein